MTCNECRQRVIDSPIHILTHEVRERWLEHISSCLECRHWLIARVTRAVREGRTGRSAPGGMTAERVAWLDRAMGGPERQAHLDELLQRSGGLSEIPEDVWREVER